MKIEEIAEYMRKNIEKNCTVEGTANLNLVKNLRKKQGFQQVIFFRF